MKTTIRLIVLSMSLLTGLSVRADAMLQTCFSRAAASSGVPALLLRAVANAASGREGDYGTSVPWPWTLRVAGSLRRYETRREAEAELDRLVALGITHVDIGLMQINWRRHHDRAESPTALLDPRRNVAVAAAILNDAQRLDADLWSATALLSGEGSREPADYRALVATHLVRLIAQPQEDQAATGHAALR